MRKTAFASAVAAVKNEVRIFALIAVGISSVLVPVSSGEEIALARAALDIKVRSC